MKRHILYTLLLGVAPAVAFAQAEEQAPVKKVNTASIMNVPTRSVSGVVVDATGVPVAGVSVKVYGSSFYAAMTDEQGKYSIRVPEWATSLILTAEGYSPVQQALGTGDKVQTVKIYSDKFVDTYKKSTTATSSHTALVDYNNNDVSIDPQLQSQLGGDMRTILRSGAPGVGVAMFMNGLNSLNANAQPLVIIDGVIQNMLLDGISVHDGFFNNILGNIMVEDIEKISVLKNGTAIYGAKAANGVVVIETKRNKSMATKIDVSLGGGYEMLGRLPKMMNAEQYRVYASELIGTTGTKNTSFKFLQNDPNYYYYSQYHNHTDWTEHAFKEAYTQNYSINVQGGDDIANYNLSVGYAKADGTAVGNSMSRFNLRLNSDIIITRNIDVRFDASYSDVTRDLRDDGVKDNVNDGVISAPGFLSLIKSPFLSPYAFDAFGRESSYLAEADNYVSDIVKMKNVNTSLANPVSILRIGDGTNKNYFGNRMVTLSATPKYHINKDWSLANQFSFMLVNSDQNYYLPTKGVPTYQVENLGSVHNFVGAMAGREISIMNDFYATFNRRFGAHAVDARGGFRYLHDSYRQNALTGYDSGNDKTPNMTSNLQYKQTYGFDNNDVDLSYYLTGNYNYRERYYVSAGVSLEGSSKFGVDAAEGIKIGNYAFGLFPSIQAAWVLTNEDWMKPNSTLNYLKLNVGYDLLGNDDIDTRASRSYFVANKMFKQLSGKTLGNIGNTKLQWETTSRLTAGLELSAIQNRLHLGFNVFHSNTYNLLSLNALSYLTGIQSNWSNGGRMTNTGFDVNADIKVLATKNLAWSINGSLGHYKNKIQTLPNNSASFITKMYGANILSQVGSPAGVFYGYRTNGVLATAEEAAAAGLYQETETGIQEKFAAGDVKFVDVDNNKCINQKDMQVIGDPNPDFYGNFGTKLSWRNLSFSATFNYSVGGDIYNYQRSVLEGGSFFYNQTTALLNRWNHEGQVTDIPRATFLDPMGNSRFSDRWMEDGSYLKLKNVTLSYHIPVNNTYLQGVTIWAAANNLFTITKYLGSDPEFAQNNTVLGQGIDRGMVAPGRSFSVGLKINL